MRKKLIGLICVLTSLESFANFPSLDNVLYQPFKTNSDIYFELESKELASLINTKLLLNLNENTNWKIFKLGMDEAVDLQNLKIDNSRVLATIAQNILAKGSFVWADSLTDYLSDFKFIEKKDDVYFYEPLKTGTDIIELKISFSMGELTIEIDREFESEKHKYAYNKTSWSDNKFVLTTILTEIKKGTTLINTTTSINYYKVGKKLWLPMEVNVVTDETSSAKTVGKVERSLSETYRFTNYKIDQKIANGWFNSHKK